MKAEGKRQNVEGPTPEAGGERSDVGGRMSEDRLREADIWLPTSALQLLVLISAFCILHSAFAQSPLTADGLAAFASAPASGGGGGGGGGDITTGLVAWWKFDEGSGTSAADSTGNGHTGTLNGTASWTTGRIGTHAVVYSGSSGGGTSFSAITTGTTFTYAAWIFPTSSGGFQNLFAESGTKGLWFGEGAFIIYYFGGEHFNTTTISLNAWHHIAVVNSAGSVTFYLDGVANGTTSSAPSFNANGMGADGGTGGEAFAGRQDDVRFYSRALSATDIATLAGM